MKQEVMLSQREDYTPEDGMLFVRTSGILTTMVRAPLIAVGLIVVAMTMPVQNSFSTVKTMDLVIYPDGTTHVFSEIAVNPLEPDFTVDLYGTTIDNFVAEDENGFLLSANIEDNNAVVETLGASTISINYDIHDLVSKEGRIWSFNIDAPTEYSLLMPSNIVIVGMSTYPLNMQTVDEKSQIQLPSGPAEINYFFGISEPTPTPTNPETGFDNSIIFIGAGVAAAGAAAGILMRRAKRTPSTKITESTAKQEVSEKSPDTETIFRLRPELREDDKELISFISENGGQAYESELRKKFLQPRTTMWRAVKRLERHGIVEIEKKELQNLVKLKKNLEDEQ